MDMPDAIHSTEEHTIHSPDVVGSIGDTPMSPQSTHSLAGLLIEPVMTALDFIESEDVQTTEFGISSVGSPGQTNVKSNVTRAWTGADNMIVETSAMVNLSDMCPGIGARGATAGKAYLLLPSRVNWSAAPVFRAYLVLAV
jgi:hypothetical protein